MMRLEDKPVATPIEGFPSLAEALYEIGLILVVLLSLATAAYAVCVS